MAQHDLAKIARAMVAKGKGILAADESLGTIEKRFKSINIASTEEHRRAYRDMLFTTPDFADYISGVIMFDETIRHATADGTPFTKLLERGGVIPGIKVDQFKLQTRFDPTAWLEKNRAMAFKPLLDSHILNELQTNPAPSHYSLEG